MSLYNPQLAVEFTILSEDGSERQEEDFITFLSSEINGQQFNDYNFHARNKPLGVEVDINKGLGSTQNTCNLTFYNHLLIEQIRKNPDLIVSSISENFYRVRVWAWHDDNSSSTSTARPNIPPVFVGDVIDGFTVEDLDTVDSSIRIQAHSHSWLSTIGKMKKTWEPGTNYLLIMQDLLQFILDKNYGVETLGNAPVYVIEDETSGILEAKLLLRSKSININPLEEINEICRELDMLWGIENNIPYVLLRANFFRNNFLNQTPINEGDSIYSSETSKIKLNSYGLFEFNASSIWQNSFVLGTVHAQVDIGSIDPSVTSNAIGRLDSLSISLSNGQKGHTTNLQYSWLGDDDKVRLPRRRGNTTGRQIR